MSGKTDHLRRDARQIDAEKASKRPHKAARPTQPKRCFARSASPAPRQAPSAPASAPRNTMTRFLGLHRPSTQWSPMEGTTGRGLGNDNIFPRKVFSEQDKVP